MSIRPSQYVILILSLGLLVATASAAPESIDRLTSSISLDDAQKSRIATYAQYWGTRLSNESPETVREARDRLIRPLRTVSGKPASLLFRSTLGRAVKPVLETTIDGPSRYQAINAMQVAAALGTPGALSLLDSHIEPDVEKRPQVRLWAAIGIGRSLNVDTIRSDKVKGSIRVLTRSAEIETDPLVLQREFEALNIAIFNTRPTNLGGTDIRKMAVKREIQVLTSVIDRLENGTVDPGMLVPLRTAVLLIRNQYIDPKLARNQSEIGLQAAPQLGRVYDAVLKNETAIRSNPELARTAGQLIELSETTLRLVDSHMRSGKAAPNVTSGRELWIQGKISELTQSRDAWQTVLAARPYK